MNIEYNNSKVEWFYEGKKIEYSTSGIEYAVRNDSTIFIEEYTEGTFRYEYLDFTGQLIISYSADSEDITIVNKEDKKVTINIPSLKDVSVGNNKNIYLLVQDTLNSKIMLYTYKGEKIREYIPPKGYICYRFGNIDNELNIICQGNDSKKDQYGRNDWNFTIDKETGEWSLKSLAY